MTEEKELFGIVKARAEQTGTLLHHTAPGMATRTETAVAVTIGACGFARVRGSGMSREEVGGMVSAGDAPGVGSVAGQTVVTGMTTRARRG